MNANSRPPRYDLQIVSSKLSARSLWKLETFETYDNISVWNTTRKAAEKYQQQQQHVGKKSPNSNEKVCKCKYDRKEEKLKVEHFCDLFMRDFVHVERMPFVDCIFARQEL